MRTLVATLTMLLLATGVAFAKPTADEAAAAREHYKRGTTLYDLGKYDEAIIEFQQAYEIKDDPVLLYNIAQSFRLSNKYNEALRFYRTYLRRAPKAPNRDEVETKIADMENLIQQQAKVATTPSPDAIPPKGDKSATIGARPGRDPSGGRTETRTEPRTETRTEPRVTKTDTTEPKTDTTEPKTDGTEPKTDTAATDTKSDTTPTDSGGGGKGGKLKLIAGIAIAVVGVGCLGAGIGLGSAAAGKARELEKAPTFDVNIQSSGQSLNTIGIAMDVVGGVLVAAGAVVAVLGVMSKPAEQKITLLPTFSPTTAGAALRLAF